MSIASVEEAFWIASSLSDPICKAHEYFRRFQIVDTLHQSEWKVTRLARRFFFGALAGCFGVIGSLAAPAGIALRALGSYWQPRSFLYERGAAQGKGLSPERSFTLLSWNVCGDLNLDDPEFLASEWNSLFEKNDLYSDKTWGGDGFCARLTESRCPVPSTSIIRCA